MIGELLVRIVSRTIEAIDIVSLELEADGDEPLPPFSAGSHIDLHVAPGLTRQYSLCNDPDHPGTYRIAVLRNPRSRGGSIAAHETLKVGQHVRISFPRNHFELLPSTRSLLFAGGIGITPLLSMAERLHATAADFDLHYCARSLDRMAFRNQLEGAAYADRIHFHVDDGPSSQRFSIDEILMAPDAQTHMYVCGPQGFIEHIVEAAKRQSWESGNVHLERFSNTNSVCTGESEFEVVIASTGKRIQVAADQSVSSALISRRIMIPTSCEQGVCGTCVTRVIDGIPDHRDAYFTDAEKARGDQFTPCCSRSRTPVLILDL